jgi:hypothetical protein
MSESRFSRIQTVGLVAAGGVAVLAGVILFCFDPAQYPFYPTCIFHRTTGLLCPGCGSLRALHQLLHGHLMTAFRFNPLLILALCSLAAGGVLYRVRKEFLHWFTPRWLWVMGIVVVAVSIWRNLPGAPTMITPP